MPWDNTNSGILKRNTRKEKDSHPSHTGSINVEGVEYWLSAWVKEKDGEKFFSLAIKPKEPRQEKPAPKAFHDGLDDSDLDAPF